MNEPIECFLHHSLSYVRLEVNTHLFESLMSLNMDEPCPEESFGSSTFSYPVLDLLQNFLPEPNGVLVQSFQFLLHCVLIALSPHHGISFLLIVLISLDWVHSFALFY